MSASNTKSGGGYAEGGRRGLMSRAGGSANASANGRGPRPVPACCNRCRKPLIATLYVVACDCVFCEDCTFDHFNSHTSCPCCRKELAQNDFIELVVADPTPSTQESTKNAFQVLFTKSSCNAKFLSHQEMCARFLRNNDDNKRMIRFLMKQFVTDASTQASRYGEMGRAYAQLKQTHNNKQNESKQAVENLQNQLKAMSCTVQEYEKKLIQKENQIAQYRDLVKGNGKGRPITSPQSQSSGGRRGPSYSVPATTHGGFNPAQRKSLRPVSSGESVITPTPIQANIGSALYNRPQSSGSNHSLDNSTSPVSRGIRDFTVPRSYSFSRGSGSGMQNENRQSLGAKRMRETGAPRFSTAQSGFGFGNNAGGGDGPFRSNFGR